MSAHNRTHTLGPIKSDPLSGIDYQECLVCSFRTDNDWANIYCLPRLPIQPIVYKKAKQVKKIKELDLDINHMRGDSVDFSIMKIEEKINEIVEVLNKLIAR